MSPDEPMSRIASSIKNFTSSVLLTAITMIVGLLAAKYLLRWLGQERFGALRAAVDWAAYIALLDFGIAGALLPLLARSISQQDENATHKLLAAGIAAYRRATV